MIKAEDQFHVGIVVDDADATVANLSELFGYRWCEEFSGSIPVQLPEGETTIDLRFTYSMTAPRLEIIRSVPGSLWVPAAGSGIHHLGYWSDDMVADSDRLAQHGYKTEAVGVMPDGAPYWAYHRGPAGPRIEIVSRVLQPGLQHYWDTGTFA